MYGITTILAQTREEKRGPIMSPSKKKWMSSGGMRKPVIVTKSVDVTEGTAKETGETSKKKEEEEEVKVILIQKILFLQLLHGFKLFHLVSDFQNRFCF